MFKNLFSSHTIIGDDNVEENKNALDEVNKGCSMGVEAINTLLKKVESKKFKQILEEELEDYEKIEEKISNIYVDYSDKEPHEIGNASKAMTDSMMNIKTMMENTDSKVAELLLQGTNMGIIEGRRILNNKKLDTLVEKIIEEFVTMQEKAVEDYKKYL